MQGVFFAACGTLFTFSMTALGAAFVFLFRQHISDRTHRLCIGFAAGVMAAASVFSLLNPSIAQAEAAGNSPALTAAIGFSLGAGIMFLAEYFLAHTHRISCEALRKRDLMFAALTLHNIPEGMAVGLAFALAHESGAAGIAAAMPLALGVGIQNIPEGAAVSLPLRQSGMSSARSFLAGAASGLVEPVFGVLVILAASLTQALLPILMAFAAGAMMYVITADMIPSAAKDRRGILLVMAGYVLMMTLDVALG